MHQRTEPLPTNRPQIVIQEAIGEGDRDAAAHALADLHPSEIADLLESAPGEQREVLWGLVPVEIQGEVLSHAHDAVRVTLLELLAPAQVAELTEQLETDDAADILQDLPEDRIEQVLRSMDAQDRQRVAAVLQYPEDTAGGLMNTDTISVRSDVDLEAVLRYLRRRHELPEKTDSLMVVDRDNRYQGMLPITTLVTANPDRTVAEVMLDDPEPIPAQMPADQVAKRFEQRDLLSAPVVDERGRLLGRITIDDVVDVIRDQGDHSLMSLAGLNEADDTFAPALASIPRRALWLGVNLITALLAAWVIGRFEDTLRHSVALAILMPLVASMGGVAGSQTLTIVIRGLALGQISDANYRSLLRKELAVGVTNGLLWATIVGVVAANWFGNLSIGMVIALALTANVAAAALAGTLIPITLKRLGIDPALAGGLFLTTVTDVLGFSAFLGLAAFFVV
ncbi:MAG: magnesium transporter [Gammaproteobacteria bacterium]